MKKILLTLILSFSLVVCAFSFSACKKDGGYQLSNLLNDYKSIADECKSVKYDNVNHRLEFDYSVFVNAKEYQYVNDTINDERFPYSHIVDYNNIFYNSMSFATENLRALSTNAFEVDMALRNEAQAKLNNLKNAFIRTDIQMQEFARNINTNSARDKDKQDEALGSKEYLLTFKHLLDSYNGLFESAFNFNITLAKIYYSLTDGFQNENLTSVLTNFEKQPELDPALSEQIDAALSNFLTGLVNRVNLVLVGYSYVFYQNNIQDGSLSNKLTTKQETGFEPMGAEFDNYIASTNLISKKIVNVETSALTKENKIALCKYSVQLFNLWSSLNVDFAKFSEAYSTINYNISKTAFDVTDYESYCVGIIEDYFYLIEQNFNTLINLYSAEIL